MTKNPLARRGAQSAARRKTAPADAGRDKTTVATINRKNPFTGTAQLVATIRALLCHAFVLWRLERNAEGLPLANEAVAAARRNRNRPLLALALLRQAVAEQSHDDARIDKADEHAEAAASLPRVLFTSLGRREATDDEGLFAAYLGKPIYQSQLFDTLVGQLADEPAKKSAPGTAAPARFDPGMAARHPLRILVAEDNVVNQKLALRLLQQMGYRADLASNGIEAIESIARQTYDVVLMDVQMPELDGLEATRRIAAKWPQTKRPRIVAMTANAMQGDREICIAAGMDDYLTKPIRVDALVEALTRATPAGIGPEVPK